MEVFGFEIVVVVFLVVLWVVFHGFCFLDFGKEGGSPDAEVTGRLAQPSDREAHLCTGAAAVFVSHHHLIRSRKQRSWRPFCKVTSGF